jgi:cell division protein ZapE
MTPGERYQQDLGRDDFRPDEAQQHTVTHTQRLYDDLLGADQQTRGLFARLLRRQQPVRGLYLWGGTGRGKTYLVDSFYACLPFREKQRIHFHRFMRDIHTRLQHLPSSADPLDIIGRDLAREMRVLCLDEFHVHDIGDAMIMAGLLQSLVDHQITLVATSNIAIDELYKNGLQRERFLGAIELLKTHNEEVNLGHGTDYRLEVLEKNGTYQINDNNDDGNSFLEQQLAAIAPCTPKRRRYIEINGRRVDYQAWADDVIWFDFEAICNTPRSANDYILIAECFHTVLIGNVRRMTEEQDNIAKRFIHLIDALYDHNVKLIVTAATVPDNLYEGRSLAHAFKRTASRLVEMDNRKYLAQPHLKKESTV